MRNNIRESDIRIAKRGFDFSVNTDEENYYVAPGEDPVLIPIVHWANPKVSADGVNIGIGGVEDGEERVLLMWCEYLADAGITQIDPAGYFTLSGERYDPDHGNAIIVDSGPNGATYPTVMVVCRKAVERAHTLSGSEFGFELS